MCKRLMVMVLVWTLLISSLPGNSTHAAETTAQNPIIWADVPDVAVTRVNDTYYMTSTTMHMNPGVPIMKSKDLVNWEIVNYVYDILAATDKQTLTNGQSLYGQGSWASSIRYHNGKFYVVFASNDVGKTFIFQTTDIEKGQWEKYELAGGVYHDMSLLFDDDGRVYLVYGNGTIRIIELTSDATAIKAGGMNKVIIQNASAPGGSGGLGAEGSHVYKINGKYYIFNISWPTGSIRTQLVHRADAIDGPYEGRIALRSGSNSSSAGVAQGGIVQAPDGKWYGMLFQDYGSVGRIPYIVPMTWSQDGWPVFGDVNDTGIPAQLSRSWVSSDHFDQRTEKVGAYHTEVAGGENDHNGSNLGLVWQWNHNPDNRYWSLTDRPGYLRLTTGRTSNSIHNARNTLTQRTFGPESSGTIAIDVSHMKDGDYAGIAAFQQNYGFVGVKMSGTSKSVIMVSGNSGTAVEAASIPITQNIVYLRTELDFKNRTDKAYFYYSLDGERWASIGNTVQMSYTIPHFMGYRFALFNFATKTTGGYVDFDYFKLGDKLAGSNFDTNLKSLEVNGTLVKGFSPNTYTYGVDLPAGSAPPQVTATANDPGATVTINQASIVPGTASVTVSREGLQTATYTIQFLIPAVVAIEAETAAENSATAYVTGVANDHTWTLVDGQFNKAMQFAPDDAIAVTPNTDAASLAAGSRLNYKINFTTAGTYYVWILAKSRNFQTDSIHVGMDNQYKFTSNGIQNVSNSQFRWINLSNGGTLVTGGTSLTITAGVHELNFWGRESGLIIDRIYVTTSTAATDPVWPEPQVPTAALSASSSVKPESSFTVGVSLNNLAQRVYAEDITLIYDSNVFDYVSAAGAGSSTQIVTEDKATAGKVRLIAANIGGVSGASTPVLNLTFKGKTGVQNTTGTIAAAQAKLGVGPEGTVIQAALGSKSISIGMMEPVVDKTALTAAIANAQSLYDAAVVGTLPGQYPQAAKDAFGVAINAAKAAKDNPSATQAQVDSAAAALGSAVDTFKAAVIKEVSADLNKDGSVDVGDLAMVAYHYGKDSAGADWVTAKIADMNGDHKIDIADLAYVASKIAE
ncbi:family 43 glycosylhydrolase [Paenibacillus silviterrae]|uniref:family 43 glycosylhydrolase n=1 Tax=Paenibacillus silviterrae TaxID=3242194 RepID=UPI00254346B3|nr:family 43 glycosylhydrolase [Paenibacillus chinjuensis]